MPAITIKVQGLDKVIKSFSKAPEYVFKELDRGIKTAVNITRPIMKQEAPVDTGKLRRNIYAKTKHLMGEVAPNLEMTPYALYVHEGTRYIRHKNQFVNRTATRVKPIIESIFKKSLDKIAVELTK